MPPGYIPSLDGFRAVSIAFVLFGHALPSLPIPGGFGVTIFFFISGYLITTLLLREFEKTGDLHFKSFYARRALRLGPPLVITLGIAVILALAGLLEGSLDPIGLASQFLFFYNYWAHLNGPGVVAGMGILWSLSVEEHFYFIFPVVLLFALRRNWPTWWLPATALAVLAWRSYKYMVLGFDQEAIYSLTDTRIDSLLWGCYLAVLCGPAIGPVMLFEKGSRWGWIALGVIGLLASLAWQDEVFKSTLRYTLQGVALMPIFYFALRRSDDPLFQPLNWSWVRRIGVYSYTLYLVHYVVLHLVGDAPLGNSEVASLVVTAAISFAYADLVYRLVEKPIKEVRNRMAARARTPNVATSIAKED